MALLSQTPDNNIKLISFSRHASPLQRLEPKNTSFNQTSDLCDLDHLHKIIPFKQRNWDQRFLTRNRGEISLL